MRGIRKFVFDVARSTRQVSLTVRTVTGIKSTKPAMQEAKDHSKAYNLFDADGDGDMTAEELELENVLTFHVGEIR